MSGPKANMEIGMKKLVENDSETRSADILSENVNQLKALFPEAFTEGKVDFEVLKTLLVGVVDEREEKYGLNWHGKRRARQLALTPSSGTLRPCPGESVGWDTTQNLMIDGDNLEVLKLLQKSYAGKIKLIYIDPPYNTGRDFVYPDNFQDNIKNYLELTGQVEGGQKISSNTEAGGRFHTDWLNMMYPRLKLARNLSCQDGVILISIDDNEVTNLRKLCDEIYGEENFVAMFTWETKRAARGVPPTNLLMENHEYVVCYARSKENVRLRGLDRDEADFDNPDNDPRGLWRSESMKATGKQDNYFTITDPATNNEFYANWAFSQATIKKMIADGLILFPPTPDGVPRQKKFIDSYTNETKAAVTALGWHSTENATKEFMDLFDGKKIFDFPKPLSLLKFFCAQFLVKSSDIALDFFAGSAGIAQAVLEINSHDLIKRQFIMVQIPEPCDVKTEAYKSGYKTIAEIAKERIRRAGNKIKVEKKDYNGDIGFRVFKLDTSNIRIWNPDRDNLAKTLLDHQEHILPGRSEADILYELLLKLGLDLCVPIEKLTIAGKDVYSIGGGVLIACLTKKISHEEVEPLAQGIIKWHKALATAGDTTCVFRDSAFADDIAKTNIAAIIQQHGVTTVHSL